MTAAGAMLSDRCFADNDALLGYSGVIIPPAPVAALWLRLFRQLARRDGLLSCHLARRPEVVLHHVLTDPKSHRRAHIA